MLIAVITSFGAALAGSVPDDSSATRVPEGFALERASILEGSFLALCFDGRNRVLIGVEDGPIRRLTDTDGDGVFDLDEVFHPELVACQGIVWNRGATYAVARRGDRTGLWRVDREGELALLAPITSPSEHGAHGIALGPDGALYLACGNEASIDSSPTGGMSLDFALEGDLLPTLADPLGVGAATRVPYGFVARVDPANGAWGYHSIGYRNHYDLAFDREGELFTVDSDMEYDVGLPWYRPVRALHARFGVDYGFRRGSSVWPDGRPDGGAAMAEDGRGSPTGVVSGHALRFPARWREAIYCGDWSRGRIVAFELEARGASYTGKATEFASGPGCASITDLCAGPDGALYLLRGGRGLVGPVQRIAWRGAADAAQREPRADAADLERAGDPTADWRSSRDGSPAGERALRRACEDFARRGKIESADSASIANLLVGDDVALAQAARASLTRLDPEARASLARELWRSSATTTAAQGALLLALATDATWPATDVARALDLAAATPAASATLLRALTFAAQRGLLTRTDALAALDERAGDAAHIRADARAAWEWDALDAHAGGAGALERFLARAESAPSPVDAIRAAWLASSTSGWTANELARFLAWYEPTRTWDGGASFRGYLEALRERAAGDDGIVATLLLDDAACGALPAPALAFVLRRVARIDDESRAKLRVRAEDVLTRYAELAERHAALARIELRRATIAEITGSRDEPVLAWLRERIRISEEERGLALIALARAGRAEDAALFVAGLDASEFGTPKACADALMSLAEPPSDLAIWSRVLERARVQGHPRGWPALRVAAKWLGLPAPLADPDQFDEAWQRIRVAVRARFPALSEQLPAPPRPVHAPERVRRFLRDTRARPTSTDAGARVFVRATCASCHTIGGRALVPDLSRGASGPDLGGVAQRLRGDELFDAVARPSLAISDQFRMLVVETRDELRFEGRAHRDAARGVALVESDGRTVEIAAEDIVAKRASTVSAMPEGLLAVLTLEEARDLFAFLMADGVVDAAIPPWEPLFGATLDGEWTGGGGRFALEDGVLVGRAPRIAESEYLFSRRRAADFEIEFDVRITRGGNSGLQYRSGPGAAREPTGYQADIGQLYWGSLYAADGRGLIHEADPRTQRTAVDLDGWNHYFLRVVGDRHVIEVNGLVLTDTRDARHGDGVFAWQLHEGLDMEVRVGNARLRVLR